MVTTAGNGGLYSRLLMAIVPLLIVATLLTVLPPAGAAVGGYKYATVLFDGFTDIESMFGKT